ncbi:hypothetical protein [Helicobacter sp. 13S00477-4]|uniref:hypothetical protein n=1 Tax=Helicobacter sp. 13S00477-4 TaxID=1905759 RepID=UPI000BA5025A|nr:hypothetical protein [Helicobacter sp. 13S00477-4]PAF51027.1 hypothetical protein BKH44_06425 [Helicobacter sp. 13S00477-4]
MKITPHNSTSIKENITSKQSSKINPQDKTQDTQETQDSIKINQSEISKTVKDINNAIGALQIAVKKIDEINHDAKDLVKISKKPQEEKNIKKADELKEKIYKILQDSNFNGENVFSKNYQRLSTDIHFDPKSIKVSIVNIQDPNTPQNFIKNLDEQKKYAKEAIDILHNKLSTTMDELKKTDSSYNTLDKSALNQSQFKNAHKPEGITLERITKLLG